MLGTIIKILEELIYPKKHNPNILERASITLKVHGFDLKYQRWLEKARKNKEEPSNKKQALLSMIIIDIIRPEKKTPAWFLNLQCLLPMLFSHSEIITCLNQLKLTEQETKAFKEKYYDSHTISLNTPSISSAPFFEQNTSQNPSSFFTSIYNHDVHMTIFKYLPLKELLRLGSTNRDLYFKTTCVLFSRHGKEACDYQKNRLLQLLEKTYKNPHAPLGFPFLLEKGGEKYNAQWWALKIENCLWDTQGDFTHKLLCLLTLEHLWSPNEKKVSIDITLLVKRFVFQSVQVHNNQPHKHSDINFKFIREIITILLWRLSADEIIDLAFTSLRNFQLHNGKVEINACFIILTTIAQTLPLLSNILLERFLLLLRNEKNRQFREYGPQCLAVLGNRFPETSAPIINELFPPLKIEPKTQEEKYVYYETAFAFQRIAENLNDPSPLIQAFLECDMSTQHYLSRMVCHTLTKIIPSLESLPEEHSTIIINQLIQLLKAAPASFSKAITHTLTAIASKFPVTSVVIFEKLVSSCIEANDLTQFEESHLTQIAACNIISSLVLTIPPNTSLSIGPLVSLFEDSLSSSAITVADAAETALCKLTEQGLISKSMNILDELMELLIQKKNNHFPTEKLLVASILNLSEISEEYLDDLIEKLTSFLKKGSVASLRVCEAIAKKFPKRGPSLITNNLLPLFNESGFSELSALSRSLNVMIAQLPDLQDELLDQLFMLLQNENGNIRSKGIDILKSALLVFPEKSSFLIKKFTDSLNNPSSCQAACYGLTSIPPTYPINHDLIDNLIMLLDAKEPLNIREAACDALTVLILHENNLPHTTLENFLKKLEPLFASVYDIRKKVCKLLNNLIPKLIVLEQQPLLSNVLKNLPSFFKDENKDLGFEARQLLKTIINYFPQENYDPIKSNISLLMNHEEKHVIDTGCKILEMMLPTFKNYPESIYIDRLVMLLPKNMTQITITFLEILIKFPDQVDNVKKEILKQYKQPEDNIYVAIFFTRINYLSLQHSAESLAPVFSALESKEPELSAMAHKTLKDMVHKMPLELAVTKAIDLLGKQATSFIETGLLLLSQQTLELQNDLKKVDSNQKIITPDQIQSLTQVLLPLLSNNNSSVRQASASFLLMLNSTDPSLIDNLIKNDYEGMLIAPILKNYNAIKPSPATPTESYGLHP